MTRFCMFMCALMLTCGSMALAQPVLVEAESFANKGGWVVDQQFMDQMGSPFLLAHGMGEPVKPASTVVRLPKAGTYHVFVRTRDWVAPHGAGQFKLLVDGTPLVTVFGKDIGDKWAWQDGGNVNVAGNTATITLQDCTGFEGRCDAIVFCDDLKFTPPNDPAELTAWRRQALGLPATPPDAGKFDVVVVGGGIAGTCTAVSAARMGLKVALVQDRPVLGGNASSEIRVHPAGDLKKEPFSGLVDIVNEVAGTVKVGNAGPAELYSDDQRLALVRSEPNITLFLNMHANAVEHDASHIKAVIAKNVLDSKELSFKGTLFVDCTGDGTIGALAGAEVRQGRESREQTGESLAPLQNDLKMMGTSNMWYAKELTADSPFPVLAWATQFTEKTCYKVKKGDWDWEGGVGHDTIADGEHIRDGNFRAVYGNWAFIKNHYPEFAKWKLDWVAYVGGRRESRRIMGDVILCQQDLEANKQYPDGAVMTGWSIDLHLPTSQQSEHFPGQEFRTRVAPAMKVKPFMVPYRCFYSRNIDNLMMAGRNISVTHVALGPVRVQKTTGMMGVVVGRAAAICIKHRATPRDVYEKHLDELKAALNQPGSLRVKTIEIQ